MIPDDKINTEEILGADDLEDPDAGCGGDESGELGFPLDMQREILNQALRYDDFAKLVSQYIKPGSFTQKAHQEIARIVIHHINEYKCRPSSKILEFEIKKKLGADKAIMAYLTEVRVICDYEPVDYDAEYLTAKIKDFAKLHAIRTSMAKTVAAMKEDKLDVSHLRDAVTYVDRVDSTCGRRAYTPMELADLPPVRYAVAKHLVEGGFSLIYGKYGTGKTFLALDLSLCMATGLPYLGAYSVNPGSVCYVVGEGYSGIRKRIWAWCAAHGMNLADLKNFITLPYSFNLLDPAEIIAVSDLARDKLGRMPDLFIFDTLTKMFAGGDYNSPKDMACYVNNLVALQDVGKADNVNTGVLTIHHVGKDASKGSVGSVNLPGACDTIITLEGDLKTYCKVAFEKMKDGDKDLVYTIKGNKVVDLPADIDPEREGTLTLTLSTEKVESEEERAYRRKCWQVGTVLSHCSRDEFRSKTTIYEAVKEYVDNKNAVSQSVGDPGNATIGINKVASIIAWLHDRDYLVTDEAVNPKKQQYQKTSKVLMYEEFSHAADLP